MTPLEKKAIIDQIRANVGDTTYLDDQLLDMYVSLGGSVNCVAARVWSEKAGQAGDLIDITEGSSTRRMSQIGTQARTTADFYISLCAAEKGGGGDTRRTRTRAIERP